MGTILVLCCLLYCFTSIPIVYGEIKICATQVNDNNCKLLESSTTEFQCIRVSDTVDCMLRLKNNQVDVGVFSAENALIGAEINFIGGTSDIIAEIRNLQRKNENFEFQTVVVVGKEYQAGNLNNLRGKRYCHPGFSRDQYWTNTVFKAFERKILDDYQICDSNKTLVEQEIEALSKFFGPSCRPGLWTVNAYRDKILKQTYPSLCELCGNKTMCLHRPDLTIEKEYNSLNCLVNGLGEVAYTSLQAVQSYFQLLNPEVISPPTRPSDYQYLCPNGTVQNLAVASPCTWIQQSWPLVITNRAKTQEVVEKFRSVFSQDTLHFSSWKDYLKNLISGAEEEVVLLPIPQRTSEYVGRGRPILNSTNNKCKDSIKWCTKNSTEQLKCSVIKSAAKTHGIRPSFDCFQGSSIECLRNVQKNTTDIVVINTNLGYTARKSLNLKPSMFVESERSGNYFGIAVVKKTSGIRSLYDLRNKRACFPIYNGLGWLTFTDVVRNNSLVSATSCADSKELWGFFKEACAPGSQDPNINPFSSQTPASLCTACSRGSQSGTCETVEKNPFFNEIGALRCLQNDAGDVAFVDLNTITSYLSTDRKNTADEIMDFKNYQVLCKDNTMRNLSNLAEASCAWASLISTEIVHSNRDSPTRATNIQYALEELNDWFGTNTRRYQPVHKMFEPFNGTKNVLIPGNPVQLANYYNQDSTYVNNYKLLLRRLESCTKSGTLQLFISPSLIILPVALLSLIEF